MEELLVLWDQPSPLIRIEAHIFETTEKISRELGLRWRGTGVSADGVRALEGPDFGLSWTAGPFDTSRGVRIDAMLRMLQEQGEGRVLSRPVVVTLNGLEAEMSSGSLLSVRLVSDADAKLQQIQTGVTLRVTPRWIEPLTLFRRVRCRSAFMPKQAHRCRTMRLMAFPRSTVRKQKFLDGPQWSTHFDGRNDSPAKF